MAFGQKIVPDPPGTICPIAGNEAGAHLGAKYLVAACTSAGHATQPGMEPTARHTERFAKPRYRPDPSMLRDEPELHIESLAK